MNSDYLFILMVSGIHSFFLSSLIEWRFPAKKTCILLSLFTAVLGILHFPCFPVAEQASGVLSWIFPFFFCFWYLSKYRDMRFVFAFATQLVLICCVFALGSRLCSLLIKDDPFSVFLCQSILELLAGCFLWGLGRLPFLHTMAIRDHGWGALALYPSFLFLGAASSSAAGRLGFLPEYDEIPLPLFLFFLCSIFLAYLILLKLLKAYRHLEEAKEKETLLQLQSDALAHECSNYAAEEKKLRIYRHDLRHHTNLLATLLLDGQPKKALEYLQYHGAVLNETQVRAYCPDPAVNAILSFYLTQAEKKGVCIHKNIQLPGPLPVPWQELTVVLANAFENALSAVENLPQNKKQIALVLRNTKNGIAFEIKNPYEGDLQTDEIGLPRSIHPGHGDGFHSIMAFKEKYHALVDFHTENGVFQLRIYVNKRQNKP